MLKILTKKFIAIRMVNGVPPVVDARRNNLTQEKIMQNKVLLLIGGVKLAERQRKAFLQTSEQGPLCVASINSKTQQKIEGFLGTFLLKTFALYTLGIVP